MTTEKLKVTRRKLTVADRLAEVDAQIQAAHTRVLELESKRAGIVAEAEAKIAEMKAHLERAQ